MKEEMPEEEITNQEEKDKLEEEKEKVEEEKEMIEEELKEELKVQTTKK